MRKIFNFVGLIPGAGLFVTVRRAVFMIPVTSDILSNSNNVCVGGSAKPYTYVKSTISISKLFAIRMF